MRAFPTKKKIPALLAAVVATAGLSVILSGASTAASQAVVAIELCAKAGSLQPLPTTQPGLSIPIWGFGIPSTPGDCSTATASLPGPQVTVTQPDTVVLTIHNELTVANGLAADHTLSLEAPGIAFGSGPTDVAPGATGTFNLSGAPGTYIYQSGGDAGRQEAMGLYGALVVNSSTAGQAYGTAGTAFNSQSTLVLSAVDPAFNNSPDPDSYDLKAYNATYWLINGKSYPDTAPITGAATGQKVLLRYVNAGYDNTSMALLGGHEQVVAKDAHLLPSAYGASAETIPAGATTDAILTVPTYSTGLNSKIAIYNRQLHVLNGTSADANHNPGGMLTFIQP